MDESFHIEILEEDEQECEDRVCNFDFKFETKQRRQEKKNNQISAPLDSQIVKKYKR